MKQKPLLLGHRGFKARFPENTLLSFQKALDYHADGFECDIQKTADGHFVVFHDTTTDRLTGKIGTITEMTLAEISSLRVENEKIPTLEEMLLAFPACYINIELKGNAIARTDCHEIAAIISRHRAIDTVMISSFDHTLLPYFKTQGYAIGMLVGWSYRKKGVLGITKDILQLKPHYVNLPTSVFGFYIEYYLRVLLRILALFGIRCVWWTVNTKKEFKKIRYTVSHIITDEVELLHTILESECRKK